MVEYLYWILVAVAALVGAAFVFWGLLGATWALRNIAWASAQFVRGLLIALAIGTGAVAKGCAVAVKVLAQLRRPVFQPPRVQLTPQVAGLRVAVLVLVALAAWYGWRGGYVSTLSSLIMADEAANHDLGELPAIAGIKGGAITYSTGRMAGRNFGGLLTSYTGVRGVVSAQESVDFCANLRGLWDYKMSRYHNPVVNQTARVVVPEYCLSQPTKMTVGQYRQIVSQIVARSRADLDWTQVARIRRLDSRQLRVLQNIVGALDGDDLVAYALTELMPTEEGGLNVAVLDFLLRNAGREYVESIPALHDDRTSFGPYQFTSYAWRDDGRVVEGGSAMNRAMRNPVPHGSVMMLRRDQHHQAAFLFGLHNLAAAVSRLNHRQVAVLERSWQNSHNDVVEFIATAHHSPGGAYRAFERWLDNGARRNYSVSLTGRLIRYGRKTRANLEAVKAS